MSDFPLSPRQENLLRRLIEANNKSLQDEESFHHKWNPIRPALITVLRHSGWPEDSSPVFLCDLNALEKRGYISRRYFGKEWEFVLTAEALACYTLRQYPANKRPETKPSESPAVSFDPPARARSSNGNTKLVHQRAVTVEKKPRLICCRAITSEGKQTLDKAEYERLVETRSKYDMFLDGISCEASYRDGKNKLYTAKIAVKAVVILSEYIQTGKRMRPIQTKTGKLCQGPEAALRLFRRARRKVDVAIHGRRGYRAFHLHQDPADNSLNSYQFRPPQDLRYCLILPV